MTSTRVDQGTAPGTVPPESPEVTTVQWRNPERQAVDYVAALWTRKFLILGITMFSAFVGFLVAMAKPNTYVSEAALMVYSSAATGSAAEAAASLARSGEIPPSQVLNAVHIVQSRSVAERVVERITPEEILKPYEPIRLSGGPAGPLEAITDAMHELQTAWFASESPVQQGSNRDLLVQTAVFVLRMSLHVRPEDRASTIRLAYRAGSPALAKRVLQEVVTVGIEHFNLVMAPEASRKFLEDKLVIAQREESEARAALQAFAKEHGATAFHEDITLLSTQIAGTRTRVDRAQFELKQSEEIVAGLRKELESLAATVEGQVLEGQRESTIIDALQTDLTRLQVQRIGETVLSGQTDAKPTVTVRKLDAQIQLLESRIEEFRRQAAEKTRSVTYVPNPKRTALLTRIIERELDAVGLKVQLPGDQQLLAADIRRLEELRGFEESGRKLRERLAKAETQVERLVETTKSFEIGEELRARGITSLRVVEDASQPIDKEGPARPKTILGMLAAGFGFALVLVLASVRLSRSLLRAHDTMWALGRNDVVAMPHLSSRNMRRFAEQKRRGLE